MAALQTARGFSLIEALVASALVATAIIALAHLFAVAAAQTHSIRRATTALVMAQSKLEELRALPWTYDAGGSPVSSGELLASPASALTENVVGWFDELDRFGAPAEERQITQYLRRWAVTPLDGLDADTLVVQVCVFTRGAGTGGDLGDACVYGIRTRKP